MSLATRCSACGTVFRVVQDQLKVSEGWVRCGRCKEVFNALEALFDLEREAPPQWKPQATAAAGEPLPVDPQPSASTDSVAASDEPAQDVALAGSSTPQAATVAAARDGDEFSAGASSELLADELRALPADAPASRPAVESTDAGDESVPEDPREFADARFNPDFALDEEGADAGLPLGGDAQAMQGPSPEDAPAFLREAEKRQRRVSPGLRAALAVLAALLVLLLGGQAAYHLRDDIAARWPQARPVVATACMWLGCEIGAPRRIEDISVESSALTMANPGGAGDAMRLSVSLRNRGNLSLAAPMIDVTLTDGNGQVVSRRALSAADFNRDRLLLAPGSETHLELLLSTGAQRAAGYTIEIFYP